MTLEQASPDEGRFLAQVESESYRKALQGVLDECRERGLVFHWGPAGTSIRLLTPDRDEPLSIAWLFPPDRGWYGLRGFNMGFDPQSAEQTPSLASALDDYVSSVERLSGIQSVKTKKLRAFHLDPATTIRCQSQIVSIMRELVGRSGAQQ